MEQFRIFMISIIIIILSFNDLYGQRDTLFIGDFYSDLSNKLVAESIVFVDSTSKEELINRFENWGGQTFKNYEDVRTSKSLDQISLRYINDGYIFNMYVRLIAEFKENKVRIRIYDEGNAYHPPVYSGGVLVNSRPPSSYFIKDAFDDDGLLIYRTKQSDFNNSEKKAYHLKLYRKRIRTNIESIAVFLKNLNSNGEKKDDW